MTSCLFRRGWHAVASEGQAPARQRGGRVRMTDIDPAADIEFHSVDGHVTVRVPLAGPVTLPSEVIECGGGHETRPPVSISTTTKLRAVVNGSRPRRRTPALVGP